MSKDNLDKSMEQFIKMTMILGVSLVGALVGLFTHEIIVSVSGAVGIDRDIAEREARAFCTTLNYKAPKVSCVRSDTHGDGYIACTVAEDDGSRLLPIECARKLTFNEGCRIQKIFVPAEKK